MSSYKKLYESLSSAKDTFTLLELATMISALETYSDLLKKHPNIDSDIKLKGEFITASSALEKLRSMYKNTGKPKVKY